MTWPTAQDFVLRVDADITVFESAHPAGRSLAAALAAQPWSGAVDWDRGQEGVLRGQLRVVRATIRFSRTGRKDDVKEAAVPFVQAVPLAPPLPAATTPDPLVLATTVPVQTPAQARAVVRLYAHRWTIATAFETMHAWGQDAFMVRAWTAIDRLLWVLALAYALLVLALTLCSFGRLRAQAIALLQRLRVVGDHLTVGKLADAIGLDYQRHARAWTHAWLF